MTDTTDGQAAKAQEPVGIQLVAQFARDISFENIAAQKAIQTTERPQVNVRVNLDARPRDAEQGLHEVALKFSIDSATPEGEKLFIMELDYAGVFRLSNVPEGQLSIFLMIECPRQLFPFARRVIHDISRDGGFPPLNVDTIDFAQLFRQEVERRRAAAENVAGTA